METINKTASEILLQAADLLEEEGKWGKGSYFRRTDQGGCTTAAGGADVASAPVSPYYTHQAQKENLTLEQYIIKHFGQTGLAHYKAAKVGLTFSYNDHSTTTKQDVINKLKAAALL